MLIIKQAKPAPILAKQEPILASEPEDTSDDDSMNMHAIGDDEPKSDPLTPDERCFLVERLVHSSGSERIAWLIVERLALRPE